MTSRFPHRTLLVALLAALLPLPAAAFSAIGEDCSFKIDQPATDLAHHTSFKAMYEASVMEDEKPADEPAARNLVCPEAGCQPFVAVEWRDGDMSHVVIPDEKGGAWIVPSLGWMGGASACNLGEPFTKRVADGVYRIDIYEKSGEWTGEDGNWCANDEHATSVFLLDVKASKWLVRAVAMKDGDHVVVEHGRVEASVCDRQTLSASMTDLRAGNARISGRSPAHPHIASGRRLTRAGSHAEAIAAFRKALEVDPKAARAWSGMGYAMLLKGDYDEARTAFRRALKLCPSHKFQAAVWFNMGLIAEKEGNPAEARKAFELSHRLRPTRATHRRLNP